MAKKTPKKFILSIIVVYYQDLFVLLQLNRSKLKSVDFYALHLTKSVIYFWPYFTSTIGCDAAHNMIKVKYVP